LADERSVLGEEEIWQTIRAYLAEGDLLFNETAESHTIWQEYTEDLLKAIISLQELWRDRSMIPRQQALLLWRLLFQFEQLLRAVPQQAREFAIVRAQVSEQLENVFIGPLSLQEQEEEALAVLSQHLDGGLSFGRAPFVEGAMETRFFPDLLRDLALLKDFWQGQPEIPKRACRAFFAIEQLAWESKTMSTNELEELAAMKPILYERVEECLRG